MDELTHIDLFSGIGGFSLAAESCGFKTILFSEIDEFCQKVLKKHWPKVPIIPDIRDVDGAKWRGTTLLTGGFPCQDISVAKQKGLGINGAKSGLWKEMFRVISEIRPKYILVENVSNLLNRGIERVLGDLASIKYDAEWHCIPASHFGAPHIRDRVWLVAYPNGKPGINWGLLAWNSKKINVWDKDAEKWGKNRGLPYVGTKVISRLVNEQPERYCNPEFLRISDGIPDGLDRLGSLGNAIVPQVAQEIIKCIYEIEVNK